MRPERRTTVWGVGTSRTLRPHWMLCELGLDYHTREILPRTESMNDPGFLELTQRGKVPLLEDGDVVIGESAAMVLYLADRNRDRVSLAPLPATDERARFDELCFFVMTELDAILYVIRRHEGLPETYGEAPVATEAARQYFLRQAGDIERRLADGRRYLLGDDFGGADLLLMTCLMWAEFLKISLPGRLNDYKLGISERPAYRQALARNFPPSALAALQGPPSPG